MLALCPPGGNPAHDQSNQNASKQQKPQRQRDVNRWISLRKRIKRHRHNAAVGNGKADNKNGNRQPDDPAENAAQSLVFLVEPRPQLFARLEKRHALGVNFNTFTRAWIAPGAARAFLD